MYGKLDKKSLVHPVATTEDTDVLLFFRGIWVFEKPGGSLHTTLICTLQQSPAWVLICKPAPARTHHT